MHNEYGEICRDPAANALFDQNVPPRPEGRFRLKRPLILLLVVAGVVASAAIRQGAMAETKAVPEESVVVAKTTSAVLEPQVRRGELTGILLPPGKKRSGWNLLTLEKKLIPVELAYPEQYSRKPLRIAVTYRGAGPYFVIDAIERLADEEITALIRNQRQK